MQERTVIINQMRMLFEQLIALESAPIPSEPQKEKSELPVLLTIKECTELIDGLTANTVRKLALQNKISYIRAGEGGNGKILVNKDSLIRYLETVMGE